MRTNIKPSKRERGQSLTELAISMTFMLILLAGAVDLGRAFFTYIAVRDAAQEGALCGSIGLDGCTIDGRARGSSSQGFVNLSDTTNVLVSASYPSPPCAGDEFSVTVTYKDFPITMPFLGALLNRQTFDISASVTDTVLAPFCP